MRARFIPTLLLKGRGLYKTVKFQNEIYVGDPINAVRIFNEKMVDELILLDMSATSRRVAPNLELISEISSEAFIPLCYGGGVSTLEHFEQLFRLGVEKVSVNAAATGSMDLISQAAKIYGSQSVVVGIDVRRTLFGRYERVIESAMQNTKRSPVEVAIQAEQCGAGEIFLNSVDRDGTMSGYDIGLVKSVSDAVDVPVIACGGAASAADMANVIHEGGAASAAAGSLFVFQGKHRAVLITYPSEEELEILLGESSG